MYLPVVVVFVHALVYVFVIVCMFVLVLVLNHYVHIFSGRIVLVVFALCWPAAAIQLVILGDIG